MRSRWSRGDGQLIGDVRVTVVVRWVPSVSVGCGTQMARAGVALRGTGKPDMGRAGAAARNGSSCPASGARLIHYD
jgi:hypothetical protein